MEPELLLFLLRLLIALLLYAFLGIILVQLWKDLQSSKVVVNSAPEAYLHVLEMEGIEPAFSLEEINLIGRADDNTIILNEATVSGYHARISYQQAQWWLEDLGSRNGTRLNDLRLSEPLVITYGDELAFGNIHMRFLSGPIPKVPQE